MFGKSVILLCGIVFGGMWQNARAEVVSVDIHAVSHTFDGMGAQIWSGDTAVYPLLSHLNIEYIRMEVTPNWAGVSQTPPTDGLRSSFDQYVSANYSSSRLTNVKNTVAMLSKLKIKPLLHQFHYPSAWLTNGTLQTEHHQDVALLWGAQLNYLRTNGVEARYVDLFNEPEGTWNCRVPPTQYNDVVKRVRQELNDRGFAAVGIVGPGLAYLDHDNGGTQWVSALDSTALASLGAFSTHAWDESFYTSSGPEWLRQRWQPFAAAVWAQDPLRQKPIFVTEYMTGNTIFHGISYPSVGSNYAYSASDTLPFAARVFEHTLSLLNGGASVPFLWEAADQSWSSSGWGLQRRSADGSAKRPVYHAVKVLTDSVTPGSAVLSLGAQSDNDIYLAAFRSNSGIVLAAVNGTNGVRTKTVVFSDPAEIAFIWACSYVNGSVGTGEGLFSVAPDNQVTLTLPADSVLTLSYEFVDEVPEKALEWKFEGDFSDSGPYANPAATATGNHAFGRGRFGQAVVFDGTAAMVELVGAAGLPLAATDNWSMNLWVYTDIAISTGSNYHALSLASMGTNSWSKNGNARGIANWGYGNGVSCYSTTMLPTISYVPYEVGSWQMITITYDHRLWQAQGGENSGYALKIYKNGAMIASFNPQGRYYTGGFLTADNVVRLLGTIPDQGLLRFAGRLDEFSIWRGVLSPGRIAKMAAQSPITTDINGDGQVNTDDAIRFCDFWLAEDNDCVADFDNNQRVELSDFAALAGSLNQ